MTHSGRRHLSTKHAGLTVRFDIVRKILFSAIVGTFTYILAEKVLGGGPFAVLATVFVGGVVLVIQFLLDVDRQLGNVMTHQSEHNEGAAKMIQLNFARVSEATELFSKIDQSAMPEDAAANLLRAVGGIDAKTPSLAVKLANSEMRRLTDLLQQLGGGGDATYPGEDRDWYLSLIGNTYSSIRATSLAVASSVERKFTDSGMWTSDLGQRSMELQRDILKRGVTIQRVFIVTDPDFATEPVFLDLCRQHRGYGVDVKILDINELPMPQRSGVDDFVVFDDQLLYEMAPASRITASDNPMWTTRLVLNPDRVQKKLELFDEIWNRAENLSSRPDTQTREST